MPLLLACLLGDGAAAQDYFNDAAKVRAWCQSARAAEFGGDDAAVRNAEACLGYLAAVHDTNSVLGALQGRQRFYCAPPKLTLGELIEVFERYLVANPDAQGLPASAALLAAGRAAWPCAPGDGDAQR